MTVPPSPCTVPPSPCFVLVNPDGTEFADPGSDDAVRHYATEARAKERAADFDEPLTPKALDAACIEIRCAGCDYVLDEDDDWTCHFDNQAEADKTAIDSDWTVVGGEVRCTECTASPSRDTTKSSEATR